METNTLLEKMIASHLQLLGLGFSIKGNQADAIAYANERSVAGTKTKAAALVQFGQYMGYLSYLARNEPSRVAMSLAQFTESQDMVSEAQVGVADLMHY